MRPWRRIVLAVGGRELLLQNQVTELTAERNRLAAVADRLEKRVAWHRSQVRRRGLRIRELRHRLHLMALEPSEYRHALGHVAGCEDGCPQCRRLAADAVARGWDQDLCLDLGALREDVELVRRARRLVELVQVVVDSARTVEYGVVLAVGPFEALTSAVEHAKSEMGAVG